MEGATHSRKLLSGRTDEIERFLYETEISQTFLSRLHFCLCGCVSNSTERTSLFALKPPECTFKHLDIPALRAIRSSFPPSLFSPVGKGVR
jgi:hypothetical protein